VVLLQDQAIATSGDYRNYHLIDGQKFSHTIDPKTLKPVFHQLALVSVISERASTADGLATALMSMGEKRAIEFAKQHQLATYMVIRDQSKSGFKIHITDEFRGNLQ